MKRNLSYNGRYSNYKYGAKRRGFIFNINLQEFKKIIESDCYYCGDKGGGIDRVDNNMGYLKENIVSCCYKCNRMKFNYSLDEFITHCDKIIKKYAEKIIK